MLEAGKVRWSQLKVGLVAIFALAILGVLIFLLTGTGGVFQAKVTIRTLMADSGGMADKAPVRLNGILIGSVDAIRLSGANDPSQAVEFLLSVQEQYLDEIPVDSVAGIAAANLLGDKFINITKGVSPQHIQPGGTLRSLQGQDIPELMAQSANLLQTLQSIVRRADSVLADVEAGRGNIGKFLRDEELYTRLNGIAAEGQRLLGDVRTGKGTLSKLLYDDALYQEIRSPLQRVDTLLVDLQRGQGTAGRLMRDPELYQEAQRTVTEIRNLVRDLNQGQGTAGKLLKDEELYKQMNVLVARLDGALDKIMAGQGTLGQLLVNPSMYEAMTGSMREFQALAKDIRANPKRFLTIKLELF